MWFSEFFEAFSDSLFRVAVCFPVSSIFLTSFYWIVCLTCTLIWSCLIPSFDFILLIWSYIFSSILSSVRSFHKFSWVFWYSCKSVVWKTFMELPLVRPLLVPVFFFQLFFWCERTSYLLLWILSSCILILYLWIFFCFAFQEWITDIVSHPADWEIVTEDHLPEQVRRSVK